MHWSEDIWLMNITPNLGFWNARAQHTQTSTLSLLGKILEKHWLHDDRFHSQPLQVCYAKHPWQALLQLNTLKTDENHQFVGSQVTTWCWDAWWKSVHQLTSQWLQQKTSHFNSPIFSRQQKVFKQSLQRLDFQDPHDMQTLNREGIQRRFGKHLASIWSWSFGKISATEYDFPWVEAPFDPYPRTTRHLDHPLLIWEHLTPFLREDFDKLSHQMKNPQNRVVRLHLALKLDDLTHVDIPIRFRNPHHLVGEIGAHETSLIQAQYSFEAYAFERLPIDGKQPYDDPGKMFPSIIGWELAVEQQIQIPQFSQDLFGNFNMQNHEAEELLQLQNELPVELNQYQNHHDWDPNHAFRQSSLGQEIDLKDLSAYHITASHRPLFLCDPRDLTLSTPTNSIQFLESVMQKWWLSHNDNDKAYYKLIDQNQCGYWVYKDKDAWKVHGFYH